MPDHLGDDMRKVKPEKEKEEKEIKCEDTQTVNFLHFTLLSPTYFHSIYLLIIPNFFFFYLSALDEGDIALLKTYVS